MRNFWLTLAASVLLVGCARNTTTNPPSTPTPPQITVASANNALAQALDTAVTTAISARDQGKISQADAAAVENLAKAIAVAGKQVNVVLRSSDPWDKQRVQILQVVSGAGIGVLKSRISPANQALVAGIVSLFNQISAAVGGPTV